MSGTYDVIHPKIREWVEQEFGDSLGLHSRFPASHHNNVLAENMAEFVERLLDAELASLREQVALADALAEALGSVRLLRGYLEDDDLHIGACLMSKECICGMSNLRQRYSNYRKAGTP